MKVSRIYIFYAILVLLLVSGHSAFSDDGASASMYGHKHHETAPESGLQSVGEYRTTGRIVRLLPAAANSFKRMQKEGLRHGIKIIPISGFRRFSYQSSLFERAVKRYGSRERAARWVAPPGYSEHHTGLAIDIGDGARPECDVEACFEETRTYRWLRNNAERFGYELSFPGKGSMVSFEPWHWRFTGDSKSREVMQTDGRR